MKYKRTFEIKYLGPTNFHGARVKITDRHRRNGSIIIPYEYELNNVWEMAEKYLLSIGIKCDVRGATDKVDFLLSDNFETDLR